MRRLEALVLLGVAARLAIASAESPRPRGVGPEFAKFYKHTETFACISYPSVIIDKSLVNDNYCDCPDGSDEPGTSACSYLSELSPSQPIPDSITGTSHVNISLPGYYCKNKGHKPEYVPFTIVNDGACDYDVCCDGSDEWEGVGGVKCEDRCAAMGKEYQKKQAEREKAAHSAGKKRSKLVEEAATMRVSIQKSIDTLNSEIEVLKVKEAEAKKIYEEVERKERGRVIAGSSSKASKVTILAGLAKNRIEELRGALELTSQSRDIAREKVHELEGILATFKEEYNPNFNDEGVKRAVKAWEDYAASKEPESEDDATENDIAEIVQPDGENNGINWSDWTEEEESDVEALYRFEEYLPMSARIWLHEKMRDFRVMLVENGILADNANSGSESKLVTNARSAYQLLSDDLNAKQVQIGSQTSDLEGDYGPDDVFRALKGKCISQSSGEYTYELCWLGQTSQKSKKGGGNTGMGNFVRFETVMIDEEVSADGKGLGSGERLSLIYDNGQHCWNGPARETHVILACAETDEIWRVVELEKCIYRMEVGTPAACEPVKSESERSGKDEL